MLLYPPWNTCYLLAAEKLLDPHTFHLWSIKKRQKLILPGVLSLVLHFSVHHQTDPPAAFPSADISFKWNYASSRDHTVPVL